MTETQTESGGGVATADNLTTSPTTGEPVRRFSGQWWAALALRNSMFIVVLLVIW